MSLSVSIHAPTRGATIQQVRGLSEPVVSIHAPTRGATMSALAGLFGGIVSIHAPTRGATQVAMIVVLNTNGFNPRSHAGSDDTHQAKGHQCSCFNPRSHAGSDLGDAAFLASSSVSIHAPTRGATFFAFVMQLEHLVSIHAPTRGATAMWQRLPSGMPSFNPRSHAGSDWEAKSKCCEDGVSIHAPTRGATEVRPCPGQGLRVSIHAPTRGATAR